MVTMMLSHADDGAIESVLAIACQGAAIVHPGAVDTRQGAVIDHQGTGTDHRGAIAGR
jgi:hypothetical protein